MRYFSIALLLLAFIAPQPAQALSTDDLVALVTMPLAVAAVSDMAGVPPTDLISLVAALNQADVAPTQFVEVVRYVPVALVTPAPQPFVYYVQEQVNDGVRSNALFDLITQRLRTYGLQPVYDAYYRQPVWNDYAYIPTVVRTRVIERTRYVNAPQLTQQSRYPRTTQTDRSIPGRRVTESTHPHGGPPGQLKKQLGVQTGAEVVHGTRPGREVRSEVTRRESVAPRRVIEHSAKPKAHGHEGKGKKKGGVAMRTNGNAPMTASAAASYEPAGRGNGGHGHGNSGGHGKGKGRG